MIIDEMHRASGKGQNGQRQDFTTNDILESIQETVPLASISQPQIELLQQWAERAGARNTSH